MHPDFVYQIRKARLGDAEAICEVLVRSIREVCGGDYRNDPAVLDPWCGNKTPENLRSWITDGDNHFVVAEAAGGRVLGTALFRKSEVAVLLCYLIPEALGKGAGSAMLRELISFARLLGSGKVTLKSTLTARRFYEKHGFVVTREVLEWNPPSHPHFEMSLELGKS